MIMLFSAVFVCRAAAQAVFIPPSDGKRTASFLDFVAQTGYNQKNKGG
jgi:hypothetical protein